MNSYDSRTEQPIEKQKSISILSKKSSKKRSVSKGKLTLLKKKASEGERSATKRSVSPLVSTKAAKPTKLVGGAVRAPKTIKAGKSRSKSKKMRSRSGTRSGKRDLTKSQQIIPLRRVGSNNSSKILLGAGKHTEPEIGINNSKQLFQLNVMTP